MTNSKSNVAIRARQVEEDIFAGLEPLTAYDVKKDAVASQLTALMIHCRKTRSDMADELGWQKSRVTKVLSGDTNLTIKTICEFSAHLGYDFDVIFHGAEQPRPRQPWQTQRTETTNLPVEGLQILNMPLEVQPAHKVLIDLLSGNGREAYISFNTSTFIPLVLQETMHTGVMSTEVHYPVAHKIKK